MSTEAKRELATTVAEKVIAYLHTLDGLNPCLRRAPEDQLRDLQRDVAAIIGDAVEQACAVPATAVEAWVSVSERLPEDAFTRLVVGAGGFRTAAYYEQGAWWRVGSLGQPERFEVRHWMPLPPPPKESR